MPKTAVINVRTELETKREAEQILDECGLTISEAFNIFLKKVINFGGIPFKVQSKPYRKELLEAMAEVEEMKKNPHLYKSYNSFQEVLDEVLNEDEV